jgi:hypothetical protein
MIRKTVVIRQNVSRCITYLESIIMAIEPSYDSQSIAIINEYLEAAGILIGKRKVDGGVYGYTALLIILCAVDAMGQPVSPEKTNTKIGFILNKFGVEGLSEENIKQVEHWYRNGLSHVGALPENIYIELGSDCDDMFVINDGQIYKIRLKPFLIKVNSYWGDVLGTFTAARLRTKKDVGSPKESCQTTSIPETSGLLGDQLTTSKSTPSSGAVNITKD